jgi:ubiquinone/menaquinone biosynthesis C-methylase UbiE
MDRTAWLNELRRSCEAKYDQFAPVWYAENTTLYDNPAHRRLIREFLRLLPPKSTLLDAACGAGRYEPFLLKAGHSVLAIDQSEGMLARARAKFPSVRYEKVGLQEIPWRDAFEGAICMDALENVCPEDWPLVLGNFHRSLKSQGLLYFTAETFEYADKAGIELAFEKGRQAGLPVVYGEVPDEEGVYHYHPTNRQVREWTRLAGFEMIKDGRSKLWYYHLLARKVSDP